MYCMNCSNDLAECVCPDKEERLESLGNMSNFAARWCTKCDKNADLCGHDYDALKRGGVVYPVAQKEVQH